MFGSSRGTGRIAVVYIALTLIWGASFLFLKIGLLAISPLILVIVRLALAAGTLAVVMVATRRVWPRDRVLWAHQAVVAALLCVVPFLVVAWGAQYVATGLAGIITAATPMATVLFTSLLLPSERLGRPGVVGLVLGAVGVVIIVGGDGLTGSIPGMLALLAGPVCFGAGYAYQRRFVSARGLDGVTEASMQMVLALGMVVLVAPFLLGSPLAVGGHGPLTLVVLASLAALGIVSTGLGYVGSAVVMQAWGAQRTASVTYLMPVVAVSLGVLFLGESLEWLSVAGALVVVIGVLVGRVPTPTEALEADVVLEAELLLSASYDALESAAETLDHAVSGCATQTLEAVVLDEAGALGPTILVDPAGTFDAAAVLDEAVVLDVPVELAEHVLLAEHVALDRAAVVDEVVHVCAVLDAIADTLHSATLDCADTSLEAVVLERATEAVEAARELAEAPNLAVPAAQVPAAQVPAAQVPAAEIQGHDAALLDSSGIPVVDESVVDALADSGVMEPEPLTV